MNRSMKKNLFFGLMALAGLFTSCSQDDTDASPTADSNQVSMSIGMPADFVKTRASAPATFPAGHTLRCILEVWTKDGSTRRVRQEQLVTAGAANITFSFELADQGDYKAVLWADYIVSGATVSGDHYPDKYYKTDNADGLKKVTIITAAYTYADQLREAFAAVVPFTKGATAKNDLTATLVRPLTKVTIAEKNTEMIGKCKDMTATYTVPSEFNAFSEEVSPTATYDATYITTSMDGTDITINGNNCKILFSDYVFTTADATLGGIKLTFTGTGSITMNDRDIPANIPLKRNNWVRAAGNLITVGNDPAVTLSVDMTTDWVSQDATDISDIVKVGDFYYADGTWSTALDANKTCIGIVFQTDPSRIGDKEKQLLAAKGVATPHGLVMSLKTVTKSLMSWGEDHDFSELTKCTDKVACNADINGLLNYTTVIDYAAANNKELENFYPAFKAVKDYVVQAPEKTTGWYLPSIGQWYDFTANLGGLPSWDDAINEGNDLTPNLYRWSNQTELVSKINAYFEPLGTGNYDAIPNGSYQKFFSSSTYSDSGIWTWFVGKQANVVQCWHNVRYNSDSAVRPILAF